MFWYYLISFVHVIVCVILILVVLLQSGKGADLAGAFGGGGTQTVFGSRGPATFLSKLTTAAAVVFMLTSLSLTLMGDRGEARSVLDSTQEKAAPAKSAPATTPSAPAPAPTPEEIRKIQEQIEAKQQTGSSEASKPAPAEKAAEPKPPAEKKSP